MMTSRTRSLVQRALTSSGEGEELKSHLSIEAPDASSSRQSSPDPPALRWQVQQERTILPPNSRRPHANQRARLMDRASAFDAQLTRAGADIDRYEDLSRVTDALGV